MGAVTGQRKQETHDTGAAPSRALARYRRVDGLAPHMILMPRDVAVLEDVLKYRFLTTSQIETLRANDPKEERRFASRLTLTRRLKLLFHHRYLRRIPRPLAQGSREPVYFIDVEGARTLAGTHGEVKVSPPSRLPALPALEHQLGVVQARLSLSVAATRQPGDALLEWLPGERVRFQAMVEEPGRRRQTVTIIPDGAVTIRIGKQRHYGFLEEDRGSETQGTIAAKCRAYLIYWESGGFARDFNVPVRLGFRVLFVAPAPRRAQTILKAIGTLSGPHELFRVALTEDITPERILTAVWMDGATGQHEVPF